MEREGGSRRVRVVKDEERGAATRRRGGAGAVAQDIMTMMMMMMTLGGALCPVRNETDNTCYKNVAAPKRAVDFETVA